MKTLTTKIEVKKNAKGNIVLRRNNRTECTLIEASDSLFDMLQKTFEKDYNEYIKFWELPGCHLAEVMINIVTLDRDILNEVSKIRSVPSV